MSGHVNAGQQDAWIRSCRIIISRLPGQCIEYRLNQSWMEGMKIDVEISNLTEIALDKVGWRIRTLTTDKELWG